MRTRPPLYRWLGVMAVVPGLVASIWSFMIWMRADDAKWLAWVPVVAVGLVASVVARSDTWGHIGIGLLVGLGLGAVVGFVALLSLLHALGG